MVIVYSAEARRPRAGSDRHSVLIELPVGERPSPATLDRLTHQFELKCELDGARVARPIELVSEHGRTVLTLEDAGGEPLAVVIGAPMELGRFLRLAIAAAVGKAHRCGLVHKDLKPAHILVNCADARRKRPPRNVAVGPLHGVQHSERQ
jgi:hypothetical protein